MFRGWYGSFAAPCLLALMLILQSCGGGGSSPTAPPPPLPSANIVSVGNLMYPICTTGVCEYALEFRNVGPGCANTVRGVIGIYDEPQILLQSSEWELNPSAVIRSGEGFVVEGCCFTISNTDKSDFYSAEAFWNDVRCP